MSTARRITGATLAGLALGFVGITIFAGNASAATQDVVITSHIKSAPDDGNPAPWARDTFIRTTTIHENDDHSYHVTIKDKGTFTTTKGIATLGNPDLKVINKVTGDFIGSWDYTVTRPAVSALSKATVKSEIKTDESFDYSVCAHKDDANEDCASLPKTGNWPAHFFTEGMVVTPSDNWYWKYTTACETMENGNAVVKDGKVDNVKGNITGQTCPPVAPVVQPKSADPTVAPVVPVAQPSLPVTGVSVPVIAGTAGVLILIGGAAYFGTRRRKTN